MSFEKTLEMPTKKQTSPSEVGKREDLGPNVSPEIAKDYKQMEEKLDVKNASKLLEKSSSDLEADINFFKEQIKIGETKDANGRYNEKLILENEVKLKEAEKALEIKKQMEKDALEINNEREKIKLYRENIEKGETKDAGGRYNEDLVLENEKKLKEAEKKIKNLQSYDSYSGSTSVSSSSPTKLKEKKKVNQGFWRKLVSALRR